MRSMVEGPAQPESAACRALWRPGSCQPEAPFDSSSGLHSLISWRP